MIEFVRLLGVRCLGTALAKAPPRRRTPKGLNMKLRAVITSLLLLSSTGCIVVGGYSSGRGFWIWPGTFVILAIVLIFFLLSRRRG